jgi:hypothetical protein
MTGDSDSRSHTVILFGAVWCPWFRTSNLVSKFFMKVLLLLPLLLHAVRKEGSVLKQIAAKETFIDRDPDLFELVKRRYSVGRK